MNFMVKDLWKKVGYEVQIPFLKNEKPISNIKHIFSILSFPIRHGAALSPSPTDINKGEQKPAKA